MRIGRQRVASRDSGIGLAWVGPHSEECGSICIKAVGAYGALDAYGVTEGCEQSLEYQFGLGRPTFRGILVYTHQGAWCVWGDRGLRAELRASVWPGSAHLPRNTGLYAPRS